ncbi:hypothetical protein MAPG_01711 [Magnaporthiopsis poae ATCC 64411]|uniref:Phosphatidylinositol glycan anchor biosynthesis class U protein n=1 Tax=Magnaporthiopsis poae (strain ATCC 64411 / 73-15) TaxID=644358 RepID=A0A0C4DPE7_MAGP6|nr:hypothetical protein MAPG_01711 [Magnaporthiopsis poae ATCC 64411]
MNGGIMTTGSTAGLYAAAAALRLALFTLFPGLPDLLTGRVEISTPVSSFKRRHLLPPTSARRPVPLQPQRLPYDGGVYHQAPLLLPLFSLLPDVSAHPIFTSLLYVAGRRRISSSPLTFAGVGVGVVSAVLLALLSLSYLVTSMSWEFLPSTYGVQLTLADLAPNVGLWWYFFIEMFDSFRSFFLAVFWLHLAAYVGGVTIRIRSQPLAAMVILLGLLAVFKPYPSVADTSLFLGLLPLFRHIFPLMRYSFVVGATVAYAVFLGPTFYYLWIYAGSGNANFFYAITLVWALVQSLLVSDLTFAVLRDEWELDRPEMAGKEIRQI